MFKKYKAWTAEEIELLKILMDKGEKTSAIAKKLNREWGSVRSKKKALVSGNLQSRNFWTIEELKTLRELRQRGLTIKQMAETMGRSFPSVKNKLRRIGIDIWYEESYQMYVC